MKFLIWLDIRGNFFSMHIVAPKKAKLTTSTKGFEEHPTTLIMRKDFFLKTEDELVGLQE